MTDFTDRMAAGREAAKAKRDFEEAIKERVYKHLGLVEVEVDRHDKKIRIRSDGGDNDWKITFDMLQALSAEFGTKDINLRNQWSQGGGSWTGPGTNDTWIEITQDNWKPT